MQLKMPPDSVTIKSCRICLDTKYSDCVSFDDGGGWLKMYEYCFGLNLSNQDMPRILCGCCVKKMEEFSNFKLQSHKSDKLWKTIINIKPTEFSENNVDKKPSVDNIKQEEEEEVYYVDSSDAEADDKFAETTVSVQVKLEEEPDYSYEENDIDNSNYEESDKLNDKSKKVFTCERCKRKYQIAKCYEKHVERNNCKFKGYSIQKTKTQEFYCGLCEMRSLDLEVIKTHLNEHSKNDDLCCKLCEYIGRDFADMETHRYSHYPKDAPKMLICHVCNKRSNVLLALQFHYRTVHLKKENGGLCTVCNKEYRLYKMWRNHERWHRAAKFVCDYCDRKFLFRNSIIAHLRDHADIKSFVCDLCGKGFKRNTNLRLHLRSVHDNTKVTCTHCDRVFKNQKCLDEHLRREAKQKQYQCDVCSKCYHSIYKLRMHMLWHADDRPFSCELCGSTYKTKPQLKLHIRKHTGFKPYKCPMCPRDFPTSKQLQVHSSVHTGVRRYKCPYCERSFHNKKDLFLHCNRAHDVSDFKISVPKNEIES